MRFRPSAVLLALGLILALPSRPEAHEIPASVTVLAFVKPDGHQLHLVVRVPLEAIRDVQFPLRGPGYLRLDSLDVLLRDATKLWIIDYVRLLEGDTPLKNPQIVAARCTGTSHSMPGATLPPGGSIGQRASGSRVTPRNTSRVKFRS